MCVIPGCTREDVKARGLCDKHYQWARLTGRLDAFRRSTRPVADRLCDVDGCEQPVKASGGAYCSPHAHALYAKGPPPVEKSCSVEGCPKLRHAGGAFCSMHAERLRRTGDVGSVEPKKAHRNPGGPCSVDGCQRPAKTLGYCTLHYQRVRKTGAPGAVGLSRRASGDGSIELGYRTYRVGNGRTSEHRLVWEAAHGPLPDGYVIHHKNHDKLDNRLENLEAMTRSAHVKVHNMWNTKNGRRKRGTDGHD